MKLLGQNKTSYLIRFDDACPTMKKDNWARIEALMDKYEIKPIVGIIPLNEDATQFFDKEDLAFWNKVQVWQNKGWEIAMHGYCHQYISKQGGLNPMWHRSEFAGVPLDLQKDKIRNGVQIFKNHHVNISIFSAPSHTFDENTLQALIEESDIRIISDTIALRPYKDEMFTFIPQICGHCMRMPLFGVFTFSYHPSTMKEEEFVALEKFLDRFKHSFVRFGDLSMPEKGKNFIDKLISWCFFTQRKIRGLK